jgi:hypothetical protein
VSAILIIVATLVSLALAGTWLAGAPAADMAGEDSD